jgi:uncharacterized glyoxalase superfamily protein PhnB
MESVSPNIFVEDLEATISWYEMLGFRLVTSVPGEDNKILFALMVNGTTTFMFQTFKSIEGILPRVSRVNGGSLLLYIKMTGIRAFFESVRDKVNVVSGLEKTFYGATEFSVIDPNNFVLTFAEDE